MTARTIWAFFKRHAWWIIPLLIADYYLIRWLLRGPSEPEPVAESALIVSPSADPSPPPAPLYGYPTDQQDLWNTESTQVYMPTASGRIESALFGSTRTRRFGNRFLPAFHMGIDIAPMRWDARNRPMDEIYAVRPGRVAYINRIAGNSNYGIYVVLVHDDPVGEIYTLYAHLARVPAGLAEGQAVELGQVIGVMGNTASTGLPMVRAHLHFEIGVIKNERFVSWYRTQDLPMVHGRWHGFNLVGVDPLAIYGEQGAERRFSMLDYLLELSPAFSVVVRASRWPDYFQRYPGLWQGEPFQGDALVMTVSEAGVPLTGRNASEDERAALGRARAHVLEVDEEVLGRNGRRHIIRRDGRWTMGQSGERWLAILTH